MPDSINDGPAFFFYRNGKIRQTGFYKLGKMDSIWQTYYPFGNRKQTVTYQNGIRNGKFIQFYESGTIKYQGYYKNDTLCESMKLYYPD